MTNLIKVTPEAIEEFNKIKQKSKNSENAMLRISFGGMGWGGPSFRLALDELKDEDDIVEVHEGIKIVYNKSIGKWLKGTVIYFSNSWFGKGLAINSGRAC